MQINPKLHRAMQQNNNMITTKQVLSLGLSKTMLSKYASQGLLERVRHGVYTLSDSVHDDMYTLMLRSQDIIFSHETALFLLGLSERTPFVHTLTIPSTSTLPPSIQDECTCYYIKPELHQVGQIKGRTTFGNVVRCYNLERTICDLLRSRSRCSEELIIQAIKSYANYEKKNLHRLAEYADLFHVKRVLKPYMEVLL